MIPAQIVCQIYSTSTCFFYLLRITVFLI